MSDWGGGGVGDGPSRRKATNVEDTQATPQDNMFPTTCNLTPDEHLQACDHGRLYIPKKENWDKVRVGGCGAVESYRENKEKAASVQQQMMTFIGNILSHDMLQCHVLQAKFNSWHVVLKSYPGECMMCQSLMLNHVFQTPPSIVLWVGYIFTFALSSMKMVEQGQCWLQRTLCDSVKWAAMPRFLPSAHSVTHWYSTFLLRTLKFPTPLV